MIFKNNSFYSRQQFAQKYFKIKKWSVAFTIVLQQFSSDFDCFSCLFCQQLVAAAKR